MVRACVLRCLFRIPATEPQFQAAFQRFYAERNREVPEEPRVSLRRRTRLVGL